MWTIDKVWTALYLVIVVSYKQQNLQRLSFGGWTNNSCEKLKWEKYGLVVALQWHQRG